MVWPRGRRFALLLLLFLVLLPPLEARADALCDFYKKFMPRTYDTSCKGGGRSVKSNAGSGSATVSDSFNINPSSLPTEPSPYGVEVIFSYARVTPAATGATFALIKGFHKIGTGLSTSSNNTFYGNDIVQRALGTSTYTSYEPAEPATSPLPNLNLGTSVELYKSKALGGTRTSLGLSGRFNKVTSSFGAGTGFFVSSKYFNLGGGLVNERVSNSFPYVQFYSGSTGVKIMMFELEYTLLKNSGAYDLDPIHIGTLTTSIGSMVITAAARKTSYLSEGEVVQWHYALQYRFTSKITGGFLINQIPGSNSLALQLYL